jgi:hypothetical protein
MDKDKAIELAARVRGFLTFTKEEALDKEGIVYVGVVDVTERLQAFAQLVRDDYRAELLAGSGEPVGYKRDDGTLGSSADAMHDMAKAGVCWDGYEYVYTADQLAAAVLREREAFAAERTEYANWLDEAASDISEWGAYASAYSKDKWKLSDIVQDYQNRAAAIRERSQK